MISGEITPADTLSFNKTAWIFFACCVVGFLLETAWCYVRHGYIESRKSLVYGPFSVAYGMGGVVLTLSLYSFRYSPLWEIFLASFAVGTVTEYICSLGQEIVFGSVAWDYSKRFMNIKGRVCLLYSTYWGITGLVWIKVIYPILSDIIDKIPYKPGTIALWAIITFFVYDSFVSAAAGIRMNRRDKNIPPANRFESHLDEKFDDKKMHKIYANSVNTKDGSNGKNE